MRAFLSIISIVTVIFSIWLVLDLNKDDSRPSLDQPASESETGDKTVDELVEEVRQDASGEKEPQAEQPSQEEIQKLLLQANVNEAYLGRQEADKVDFTEVSKSYGTMVELGEDCDGFNLYFANLAEHNPTMHALVEAPAFKDGDEEFFLSDNYDLMEIVFKNLPEQAEYSRWYKEDFTEAQSLAYGCAEQPAQD